MISRYKFFEDIYNEDINHLQKGMLETDLKTLFETDEDVMYEVPKEEEFRPDLISQRFYGNPKLYWILVYVNQFGNSPEDFEEGTVIRVPHYNRVVELI
jgi:hypothetical protein